jgi:hypothetical protein
MYSTKANLLNISNQSLLSMAGIQNGGLRTYSIFMKALPTTYIVLIYFL